MAQVTGKSGILNKLTNQAHEVAQHARDVAQQPPHEGNMTRAIEQQTAKIPSIGFLGLAVGSMVASAALAFFAQRKELANFVGLWAPSLLLIGVYNKLVKMEAEGTFGGQQSFSGSSQNVSGQDYSQSYGTSQGYSQGFSGQGASEQGITGQGYTGI